MKINIAITLLIPLSLAACTHMNAPKRPRADQFEASQIHVDSEELRNDTAVGTPVVKRDDSGNLVFIRIPIRSAIDKTVYVDYFITFFDRQGMVLSKLGPFTKTLQANTPDSIEVNSMSPRAADFQVDLRYAR